MNKKNNDLNIINYINIMINLETTISKLGFKTCIYNASGVNCTTNRRIITN